MIPAKDGVAPIQVSDSEYRAKFSTYQDNPSNISDGVCNPSVYVGSQDVSVKMQKYNKDYFKDYTSTYPSMRAVAYMLDTTVWVAFATSNKNYAEWSIGGPTIELLFIAYNKYAGTSYEADAITEKGYKVRKMSSDNYEISIDSAIIEDTSKIDNPYSVSELSHQAQAYWLASPAWNNWSECISIVDFFNGKVGASFYNNDKNGFRPLVLLDSNYTLEKTKDSNKNDAFKIVEQ